MMSMAIVTLAGAALIAVCALLAHHHAAVLRREAAARLEKEACDKIQQGKALDVRLAQDILGGADVDSVLDHFQKQRGEIHAFPGNAPWMWEADDLTKWSKAELAKKEADINRKARLITLLVLVGVALVVVAIDAVLYSHWSAAPPVLSPYPPAKSTAVPSAVPGTAPADASTPSAP